MGGCASKPKDTHTKVPAPETAAALDQPAPKSPEAQAPAAVEKTVETKDESLVKDSEPKPEAAAAGATPEAAPEAAAADAAPEVAPAVSAPAEPSDAKPVTEEQPTKPELPEKDGDQLEKPVAEAVAAEAVKTSETTLDQPKLETVPAEKKEEQVMSTEPAKPSETS